MTTLENATKIYTAGEVKARTLDSARQKVVTDKMIAIENLTKMYRLGEKKCARWTG